MIGLYILISFALEYENKAFKFGMSMRLDKRWYDYSDIYKDPRYHYLKWDKIRSIMKLLII